MTRPPAYRTAPTHMTRSTPNRSAIAPAIGWPNPHNRFCTASARPKTSRPHENSQLIGWTKKPRLDRGPKLNRAITQPQRMITSGVGQLTAPEAARSSPAVAVIQIPRWLVPNPGNRTGTLQGVNAYACNRQYRKKFILQHGVANGWAVLTI